MGRMLVYVRLLGKSNHFSTKCFSSRLLPFLPSAICTEIAETLKTGKGSMTFLVPACLSNEFFLSIVFLQPQEKGESLGIEKMDQGFNSALFFFIVGIVCMFPGHPVDRRRKKRENRESDGKGSLHL